METEHTKGKWIIDKNEAKTAIIIRRHGHKDIATVWVEQNKYEEAEANAKLIAAAPLLLEALKISALYVSSISNKKDWEAVQKALKQAI